MGNLIRRLERLDDRARNLFVGSPDGPITEAEEVERVQDLIDRGFLVFRAGCFQATEQDLIPETRKRMEAVAGLLNTALQRRRAACP